MRPKIKFRSAVKKNYIYITFHCGQNEMNFCFGVVEVKRPIKKCKQTKMRCLGKQIKGNIADVY